jgi:hypothetical protein
VVETTIETRPDGGQNKYETYFGPQEFVSRRMKERPEGMGPQEFMLEIVRKCARELAPTSARGEREALQWFLGYIDGVLASMSGGKPYYPIAKDPEEAQIEGVSDATPDAETRAFAAIKKAINASVERIGKHEGTDPENQAGWTPLAKKKARRAHAKMLKKFEPLEVEDEDGQLHVSENVKKGLSEEAELPCVGIDLVGLATELKLDRDLRAYLQHYGEAGRAQMAALLTRETGETWDAKRVDRARKRFEYHRPAIKAAAPKHLTVTGPFPTPSIVRVKTALGAEGMHMHALLAHLFRY